MNITIYHFHNVYGVARDAAGAIKTIHILLENNDVDPKDIWASITNSPAQNNEADFALAMIKTELKSLAKEFAVAA
jgi:hypothetical protein